MKLFINIFAIVRDHADGYEEFYCHDDSGDSMGHCIPIILGPSGEPQEAELFGGVREIG